MTLPDTQWRWCNSNDAVRTPSANSRPPVARTAKPRAAANAVGEAEAARLDVRANGGLHFAPARTLGWAAHGMEELRREAYGPTGDAARHRPLAELEAGLAALAPAPADLGRLAVILRRHADGTRETPPRVQLTPEDGVPGDGWARRPPRDPEAQLAVMRRDVAELIANGQPITLFGDNLYVDLDISAANLPCGTRLRVGDAVVEVTPKPHNGCVKFRGRFGDDALRFVQAEPTRPLNLRGIYWRVVEPGEARRGASIVVLSRGAARSAAV